MTAVHVVGGGLAGAEAAWQCAQAGYDVRLSEMRPSKLTPAHQSGDLAELVCSNSFRAQSLSNAAGLLKEELRQLNSLIMACADCHAIGAGGALAVDRKAFAQEVTHRIQAHPRIHLVHEEVTTIPPGPAIIATGPLTSDAMAASLQAWTGESSFYFYDAAAPIVMADSVDMDHAFWQSRYDKGPAEDYLNCPLDKATYEAFYQALMEAEWAPTQDFEEEKFFEGCMPIETMAGRGMQTLLFGPMKPVGLVDPRTGQEPYAVLQLRRDDAEGRLMNLVGFQTRMKWPDQDRVFRRIPALAKAEFVRFGVMHRNAYLNSPRLLDACGRVKDMEAVFMAGQMTGVEGYIESVASGLVAGLALSADLAGNPLAPLPLTTAIGSLMAYISSKPGKDFQPMHTNFGLMPPLANRVKPKSLRNEKMSQRALADLTDWQERMA